MGFRLFSFALLCFAANVLSQCNKCANQMDIGSTGLPTYDLIHEFQFSEFAQNEEIMGSIASQHAYHILSESNWTRYTTDVLPRGIPYHFWFEATYRSQLQSEQPWYLFHVTNAFDVTQISITFDTANQLIGIGLPDTMGNVQHVFFRHSTAFDHAWHKIFVNVLNDQVQVWIDCQQAVGVRGEFAEPLLPRRQFETNGRTYIARYVDEANYYSQSTPIIDVQWMVLGCESTKPSKPSCDELPQYEDFGVTESPVVQPYIVSSTPSTPELPVTHEECTIQCPQGPPGEAGQQGEPGLPGLAGLDGVPGVPGLRGLIGEKGERGDQGEKGERGEPGLIITRTEGENNGFGEVEIREICSNVVKEQLEALKPSLGLSGPQGPPGMPGKPGRMGKPGVKGEQGEQGLQGVRGEQGERGNDGLGRIGVPGPQGAPGIPGADGYPGQHGERGEPGRDGVPGSRGEPGQCPTDCYYTQMYMQQLQAAQAQQSQNKGPTPLNLNYKG